MFSQSEISCERAYFVMHLNEYNNGRSKFAHTITNATSAFVVKFLKFVSTENKSNKQTKNEYLQKCKYLQYHIAYGH